MQRFITILIALFIVHNLHSQDMQFRAAAPLVVENGEQFRLTYSLNQQVSSFNAPKFDNFNFLGGPTQSQSSSYNMVNGKMSQSFELSYTYYLQAIKEGKFTIAPAQASIGGKVYSSNAVQVEVVKGAKPAAKSNSPTNKSNSTEDQPAPDDFNNEDLFLRVLVDKKSVYFGEAIMATVKIYSRINLAQVGNAVPPSFAGFFKNDMETKPLNSLVRENVNGQIYNTGVLQRFILYPQKTGEIAVEAYKLDCIVQQVARNRNGSLLDDFFGPSVQNVKRTISSKSFKITVKPLPENKPAGFNGAIGDFTMKVIADKSKLKENDALTIKIEVSGTGNIKLLESPRLNFPPDFEAYDPKISSTIAATGNSGNKIFEYLAIPRHPGKFRIPPVEFAYFNPATGSYKSLSSSELNIAVEKADESQPTNMVTGLSREDLKYVGNDIRFIKTGNILLLPAGKTFAGSIIYYLFFPILLTLFIALTWLRRKQIRENADLALIRNRKASKIAKKRLKTAEKHMHANQKGPFYDELLNALYGYLSDKLRISLAELSMEKAIEQLQQKGIEEILIKSIADLMDRCQYARYAPSDEQGSLKDDYTSAAEIIRKLEQNLR